MTLKTKMSLLLFLTSISIVSIGFSSWSITAESVAEAKGNIEVDNVEAKKLADFGFTTSDLSTSIDYVKHVSSGVTNYYISNFSVSVTAYLDLNNEHINSLEFDNANYNDLIIKFSIPRYSNISKNSINSLTVSLQNYPSIRYDYQPIDTNCFNVSLKSKENISLYTLALFDSTNTNKDNLIIPINFTFNFDSNTL